jgi:putative restriction endonuclease
MLAPHIDVLFDEGLIAFADDGTLMISPNRPQATIRKLGLPLTANVGTFCGRQRAYLARHRDGVFEK